MKTKIIIPLFSLAFLSAVMVMGQNRLQPGAPAGKMERLHQGAPGRQAGPIESLLSDEQKEAVKSIRMKNMKELKPLKDKLRELEAHQVTLTTAAKADMPAIYAGIEKIGGVKIEMAKIMAKERQDIRALLTEEQLLKFELMRQGMRHGMKQGMGPGMKMHKQFRNRFPGQPGGMDQPAPKK